MTNDTSRHGGDAKNGSGAAGTNPFGGFSIDFSGNDESTATAAPTEVSFGASDSGRTEAKVVTIGSGPAGLTASGE